MSEEIEIITFYEFKTFAADDLASIVERLKQAMIETGVRGTLILAEEGYNSSLCGRRDEIAKFVPMAQSALGSKLKYKSSFAENAPFRKLDVKIRPEIVTFRRGVDMSAGVGSHVPPSEWNQLISDPETFVLDARNDYEYKTGTFANAVNPVTEKFSDLPAFVEENLSPDKHKRIAMFCTGGIRCEKFAPYMRSLGFEEVYQLEGGILKYLETIDPAESLWEGECYVFDERVSVDHSLKKGRADDASQRHAAEGTRAE